METNKDNIANQAAQIIIQRHVGRYSELTTAELVKRNLALVEIVIQYLRDGDIAVYRNSIKEHVELRRQQGFSGSDVSSRTTIMIEKVIEIIELEMAAPELEQTKNDYINRIMSIAALGKASTSSAFLKKGNDA